MWLLYSCGLLILGSIAISSRWNWDGEAILISLSRVRAGIFIEYSTYYLVCRCLPIIIGVSPCFRPPAGPSPKTDSEQHSESYIVQAHWVYPSRSLKLWNRFDLMTYPSYDASIPACTWYPNLTLYRLVFFVTTGGLGITKAVLVSKNEAASSTTVEWVAGVVVALM